MNLFFYSWREVCKSCLYLAGARFGLGMWKGKMEKYCGLLDSALGMGDNSRGQHECRTPPRQFSRDIINSYHVLTNIFRIPTTIWRALTLQALKKIILHFHVRKWKNDLKSLDQVLQNVLSSFFLRKSLHLHKFWIRFWIIKV